MPRGLWLRPTPSLRFCEGRCKPRRLHEEPSHPSSFTMEPGMLHGNLGRLMHTCNFQSKLQLARGTSGPLDTVVSSNCHQPQPTSHLNISPKQVSWNQLPLRSLDLGVLFCFVNWSHYKTRARQFSGWGPVTHNRRACTLQHDKCDSRSVVPCKGTAWCRAYHGNTHFLCAWWTYT